MPNSKTPARRVKNARVVIVRIVARAVTVAVIVIGARVATVVVIVRPVVTVDQAATAAVGPQSRMTTTAPPPNSPPPSSRATATKHKVLERTTEKGLPKGGPFFVVRWLAYSSP